jgi:dTDP-4-dehydrorhamnose reductase
VRVLITGGAGQLGTELAAVCGAANDEVLLAGRDVLDITSRDQTLQVVEAYRPDVVMHCGAWTDVDGCETDPGKAYLVNALASRIVAEAVALQHGRTRMVAISTDYVFNGVGGGPNGGVPYTEWDEPAPLSMYGKSKLAGEREVTAILGGNVTIVRTSWVCGVYGKNFVKTMHRLATADPAKSVTVVDDQVGCPSFTADLARHLRMLAVGRYPGTFHLSNEGAVSWCDFAKAIFAAAGQDPDRVVAIPSSELLPARPAPRPSFSVLDNAATRGLGLTAMPPWQTALAETIRGLS